MAVATFNVLLVDDHDESLVVLARLLRRCSYEVQIARTYAEGIEAARRQKFDLLISDVGLPDRSGLELMQDVCSLYPVKGIALSGFTEDHDIRASHVAGFAKHLNKPVMFANLLEAIQEVVGWQPGQEAPAVEPSEHAVWQ
jgi:CheY-like chemotaxis protein